LAQYTNYESLGKEVSREVSTIFPNITKISIANIIESSTDTAQYTRYILTVIESNKKMGAPDTYRLQKWLKARTKSDSIRVIVDHQN
ncbi:TIGR00341 family protein, partial [Parabacteroides distasonis]